MSENRMLRRAFGPERNEVTGYWRKLQNEELHKLHTSPYFLRLNIEFTICRGSICCLNISYVGDKERVNSILFQCIVFIQ
jgi:hypothetical protein